MEQLPKSLRYIITEANEAIINHPNGELILPLRKKIWMELGICQENDMPTIGTIRRTMLEIFNIERLMYLWRETLPNDNRPEIIIENIKRYFSGEVSREECLILHFAAKRMLYSGKSNIKTMIFGWHVRTIYIMIMMLKINCDMA